MRRNSFLQFCLTAVSFSGIPFAALAKNKNRGDKGFKIGAGEARIHGHIKLKGVNANILDTKISGQDTDGDLALFEQTGLSPMRGTPLHVHALQDEIFYVQEGEYYFQVGTDKYRLKGGESIFLPRAVPHAWTQVSEKSKALVLFNLPARWEIFS